MVEWTLNLRRASAELDRMLKQACMKRMDRLARIVALILLTIFVVGTVAHEANATSMSLAMSSVAMAEDDMGNCAGCPLGEDGKASLCSQHCLASFAAVPAAAGLQLFVMAVDLAASPVEELVGQTDTPDPPPPRTIIL